ncbi:CSMD1 [Branchiostoma lanceolatum]|uniref:CSMD1 protein n=1 Tax=Branchiostoma lanceolatum TaxID=7740 RepID=A0A8K0EUH1_BRALA|nr:CSMD1 [Branchiostoma lanceolatum]
MNWCLGRLLVTTWILQHLTIHAQEHGNCGAYITGQWSGFVYSPNYPGQYGNNLYCTWTIEVNTGEGVIMTPVLFALEENYDWLDVYEGEVDDPILLGSYTGHFKDVDLANLPQMGPM